MGKLYVQNLGLIITEKCNLSCKHCMRGGSVCKDMSDEVIEATFSDITDIGNLTICGGEVTLASDTLEKILTHIVDRKITLQGFSTTINGTIYNDKFMRLLDYINEYISKTCGKDRVILGISKDIFHNSEISRLNMIDTFNSNLLKYVNSPYFYEYRELNMKIFREGRATSLDEAITVPLHPWPIVYSHLKKQDVYEMGPLISVNVDGIVTECDASIESQRTIYNYGSVLEESLLDICMRVGKKTHPLLWYSKTGKIMKKQLTYDK